MPSKYLVSSKPNRVKNKRKDKSGKFTINKPIEVNLFLDKSETSHENVAKSDKNIHIKSEIKNQNNNDLILGEDNFITVIKSHEVNDEKQQLHNNSEDEIDKSKDGQISLIIKESSEQNTNPNIDQQKMATIDLTKSDEAIPDFDSDLSRNPLKPFLTKMEPKTNRKKTSISKMSRQEFSPITNISKKSFPSRNNSMREWKHNEAIKYQTYLKASGRLIYAYEKFDLVDVCQKLDKLSPVVYRLRETNKCIRDAITSIFYFLNFYKDFEEKILNNNTLNKYKDITKIRKHFQKNYSLKAIKLSLDDYENWLNINEECLSTPKSETDFSEMIQVMNDLEKEFMIFKNKTRGHDRKSVTAYFKPLQCQPLSNKRIPNTFNNSSDYVEYNDKSRERMSRLIRTPNSNKSLASDKIEQKLERVQSELNEKVTKEIKLNQQIVQLKDQVKGYKKILENNIYYLELKDTISNLSSAILNKSNIDIKQEEQNLLKPMFNESLREKIFTLEVDINNLQNKVDSTKLKLKDELRHSNEAYQIWLEYINLVKACKKMIPQSDKIMTCLKNAKMNTSNDLTKITKLQEISRKSKKSLENFGENLLNSNVFYTMTERNSPKSSNDSKSMKKSKKRNNSLKKIDKKPNKHRISCK